MKEIILKDFLLKYNFRRKSNDVKVFDSSIIRIYLDEENSDDWIEIGLYDYDSYNNKILRLETTLNDNLLNRKILFFNYDEDEEVFCIFLDSRGDCRC